MELFTITFIFSSSLGVDLSLYSDCEEKRIDGNQWYAVKKKKEKKKEEVRIKVIVLWRLPANTVLRLPLFLCPALTFAEVISVPAWCSHSSAQPNNIQYKLDWLQNELNCIQGNKAHFNRTLWFFSHTNGDLVHLCIWGHRNREREQITAGGHFLGGFLTKDCFFFLSVYIY